MCLEKIETKLASCFAEYINIKSENIAVAVSGGIDSLALLFSIKKWIKDINNLTALTIDHKLRENSSKESQYVHSLCKEWGIKHEIIEWQHSEIDSNLEAQAREQRYILLSNYCKKNNIKYLFVAHHIEDQAETFFIRLFRGSGIDGLSSMQQKVDLYGITIIRPFLFKIHKEDLKNYLLVNKIDWVEDESNSDEKYLRNKIRNFINSFDNKNEITERICFATKEIGKCKNYIDERLLNIEKDVLDFSNFGSCLINLVKFSNIEEDLALRMLAKIAMKISGNIYKPRLEKLKRLYLEIKNPEMENSLKYTFYGCVFQSYNDNKIVVYREYNAINEDILLEYNKEIIWDNRFSIKLKKDIKDIKITHVKETEFNKVLKSIKFFDPNKYKELSLIKGIEKSIFYTLPIVKLNDKYLFDYYGVEIKLIV